jgi:hypothetical protein
MSNSKLGTVSIRKELIIVTIAFSGLLVLGFAGMVEQARATILPQLFNRVINIPVFCQPYCNIDDDQLDREIVTPVGTIRLDFSFLSFRGR